MEYIAYLHTDGESNVRVSFYDFPGCVAAGSSLEEAKEMAREALAHHLQRLLDEREPIPVPSTLDMAAAAPERKDAVILLVPAEGVEKTVRVNITARESQLRRIDDLARANGMSRSAYMVWSSLSAAE